MFYSSRTAALVLAGLIGGATTALLALVEGVPPQAIVLVACLSFTASFVLIYSTLEFLVYRQVHKVYKLLERINKKELKAVRRQVSLPGGFGGGGPIQRLNREIASMASRKQAEIEQLRKLELYRREFLADISHELKTPLFAAQGFIHTLLDGAAEDEVVRERFLRKAARSLDGLGDMVHELLLLSQLETGVLQMRPEVFELASLVREVAEQLEEKASSRQVEIRIDAGNRPLWVEADKSRIRQVLVNLTENAIKYGTEGGHVRVYLDAEKEAILVRVADDGPGIAQEHLARIFERFYRVEKSRNKDSGGSGLGLAIVKQIVEAHGSRIVAKSAVGKGTEFVFKLRRRKPREVAAGVAVVQPVGAHPKEVGDDG